MCSEHSVAAQLLDGAVARPRAIAQLSATRRAKRCRTGDAHSLSRSGLRPSPCRRRGTALAVDEVSKDKNAHYCKSSHRSSKPASEALPHRRRAFTFAKRNLHSPMRGRGTALAVDEVSKDKNARHCMSSPRSSNPAGRSPSPGGVGWRGLPLRTIKGADSGFRRTACIHPRRAKRKAQVCGEVAVGGDGQWNKRGPAPVLAPHPPLTRSPFPS